MELNRYTKFISLVKNKKPLVHHITNVVTINDCANVTLAIGASPVMTTNPEEVEDMVKIADALVLNIGTISDSVVKSIIIAGKAANKKGIPVILDPVGVGATPYRKRIAKEILKEVSVSIIRGNASEIYGLIGGQALTKGVDAGDVSIDQGELALNAAKQLSCVVVVSGKVDAISDGTNIVRIYNGDSYLPSISGTGCMLTSLIGSFAGCSDDLFGASIIGTLVMGLAGERAKKAMGENGGIGTFRMKLMDEISNINVQKIEEGAIIRES